MQLGHSLNLIEAYDLSLGTFGVKKTDSGHFK